MITGILKTVSKPRSVRCTFDSCICMPMLSQFSNMKNGQKDKIFELDGDYFCFILYYCAYFIFFICIFYLPVMVNTYFHKRNAMVKRNGRDRIVRNETMLKPELLLCLYSAIALLGLYYRSINSADVWRHFAQTL